MRVIALCAAALFLTSCVSKEPGTDVNPVPDSAMSSVSVNGIEPPGGFEMLWENKDEIALRYQKDASADPSSCVYAAALAAPKATAEFKKKSSSADFPNKFEGRYIAVYPASAEYMEWGRGSYVMLAPKSEQIVRNKKIDKSSSVMIAASEDSEFTFAHVVSYVKFTVTSKTSLFNKVTVTSGDAAQYMVSRIRVNFDAGFPYSLHTQDASGKVNGQTSRQVSLATADKTSFPSGTYLIAINPGTYSKGLRLTFEDRPGSTALLELPGSYSVKPGDVIEVGELGGMNFQVSESFYPQTEAGKILEELSSEIVDVLWDTTYNVTRGLDYYKMRFQTKAGEKLDAYLLRTDMSQGLDVKVAVSSESTPSEWYRQILTQMAAHIDSRSNPVYAMINADFCDNRTPIRPRGPVHMGGEVWCPTYSLDPDFPQQGLSYVGVTEDGRMTIGTRGEYEYAKSALKECTGAGVVLVQNSEILVGESSRDPRTGIGYTPENIVWMLAVDGRHKGTEGVTYMEMASVFSALGCEAAVNLDGGGSTEMIVRNPRTDEIEICNWPSDPTNGGGGQERPRPNAWAVVKK